MSQQSVIPATLVGNKRMRYEGQNLVSPSCKKMKLNHSNINGM